jgi:p-cumate 2,3-dioxygenase alpha subunit
MLDRDELEYGEESWEVDIGRFVDRDRFEREKVEFFHNRSQLIAYTADIPDPGDYYATSIAGKPILLTRGKDGKAHAFLNACRHRGVKIAEGCGNAKGFTCPYHGWTFSTEGKLLSQNTSGGYRADLNADGHLDLMHVPRLEDYRGFYFVNFNARAISLHDYLDDARNVIDAVCDQSDSGMVILPGEHNYTIRANYKLLMENSYDGYHLDSVHASYIDHMRDQVAGTPAAGVFDAALSQLATRGQARGLGNGHAVLESFVPSGRPVAFWLPSMGAAVKPEVEAKKAWLVERYGRERGDYIADTQKNLVIFPNLVINDIQAVTVRYVEPESENFMRVSSWAMGPAEESATLRAVRLDNYISFLGPAGFGSPDDIEMLEISQRGMEHAQIEWTELSKGMGEAPRLKATGTPVDEVQMQAYWTQWDRVMGGLETLETGEAAR